MRMHDAGLTSGPVQPHIPFPTTGSYPVRAGNAVRPLVGIMPSFRRIGEAVETARQSVWVTVAFLAPGFRMPDGRGSLFDLLDRAVARGLDVRVIFWRPDAQISGYGLTFPGSPANRDMLRARGSRFRARWDRAEAGYCQHQKSWLIDAGRESEIAFVGGINLTARSDFVPPDGVGNHQFHDMYVEVSGPAASDVHHNFVQRWNEASERSAADGAWSDSGSEAMDFPTRLSPAQGESIVQIQRTIHAGRYRDGRPSPEGRSWDIAGGEQSVFEQYRQAIEAARRSIYIENQALPIPPIAARIEDALQRGVEVVALVPADPEAHVRAARRDSQRSALFKQVEALGRYDNFALVGMAGRNAEGGRSNVYVHGKIMLVDDAWATIGSCNLHAYSLFGNTEMNASFWDPTVVRALRRALLAGHLGRDTAQLDDRAALALYRSIAEDNRRRREAGDADWQGLVFRLDPASYAV
jgi:phosphatidylserine/phosphatidylglycerophosphate/cardiolipin synthase-like enzyme